MLDIIIPVSPPLGCRESHFAVAFVSSPCGLCSRWEQDQQVYRGDSKVIILYVIYISSYVLYNIYILSTFIFRYIIEHLMIFDNYQQTHRLTKCHLLEMVSHLKILYLSDDIVWWKCQAIIKKFLNGLQGEHLDEKYVIWHCFVDTKISKSQDFLYNKEILQDSRCGGVNAVNSKVSPRPLLHQKNINRSCNLF